MNKYMIDAKSFGVEILPPHINNSDRTFTVKDGKILFGLEAIKGVGEKFVDNLLAERQKGKFKNFDDFYSRIKPSVSVVIALVKADAIPCKDNYAFLEKFATSQFEKREYKDVTTLPKLSVLRESYGIDTDKIKSKEERLAIYNKARAVEHEKMQKEKFEKYMNEFRTKYLTDSSMWQFEALSIFLKNNPFEEAYLHIKDEFHSLEDGADGVIVGVISDIQKKKDRHGKQFAFIWLCSAFGLIEVTCWHSEFKLYEELIKKGSKLALLCKKNDDKAIVKEMKTYDQWLKDRNIKLKGQG